ncbi:MAG: class I SAM-dependent methyltransferase [Spirochaetes bacterium]|nr:class I SAM-dependent methyltransferase [Spirochaetota bacterium]
MFAELLDINRRPRPFEYYTAPELWTDDHTSKKMLEYHLDGSIDVSSRNFDFIDRSSEWMLRHLGLSAGSEILDFGCGPGLYTSRFAKKGMKVTGVDFSRRSIDYARRAARDGNYDADYECCNYLEYDSPKKYDLITMIMCDYCALSPGQRKNMLARFMKMLKPGGAVVLDVYSLNFYDAKEEKSIYEFNQMDNFWSENDYYSFQNTFKYDDEKVVLDKYTVIEPSRRRVIYNWLQCFSVDSLKNEFEGNGLNIVEIFSDVSGAAYAPESPEIAVVARIA